MIPNTEPGDAGADRFDDAGVVRAEDEGDRELLLVLAEYLQVIGVVEACCSDPNPDRGR